MNISELAARWRTSSPGNSAATYSVALAILLLLAGVPFVLLSWAAPDSKAERSPDTRLTGSLGNPRPASSPSAIASLPGVDVAAPPSPQASSSQNPQVAATRAPAPAAAAPAKGAKGAEADFEIECWPTLSVVPGGTSTVDCNVPVFNGDGSDISLSCRVEGMTCAMSPEKVRTTVDNRTLAAKLTVVAPESAPVGIRKAVAIASGGETGAAAKQADVDVNIPPPFTVSCESIGAAFAKGADAKIKCWVAFLEGYSEDVALAIKDSGATSAGLDVQSLRVVPNQTRSFTIQLNTGNLESGIHAIRVGASTARYQQDAVAAFQVLQS
jgi:hypothetical protein